MDTKILHDLLMDDGFNLKSYESNEWEDAANIWLDHILKTPSELMDFWLDSLAELHDTKKVEQLARLLRGVGKVHEDVEYLKREGKHGHTGLIMAYSNSLAQNSAMLGGDVYKAIAAGAEAYVNKMAQEWFTDVLSYAGDMEEGQYDDYQEQRARERMYGEDA